MVKYIQSSDVKIPGIDDNSQLSEWIDSKNIKLHQGLKIGQSSLGGIGLFLDKQEEEHPEEDYFEILRIPRSAVFDIVSLLNFLDELKLRDRAYIGEKPVRESELIVNFLSIVEPNTETRILTTYFNAFKTLQNIHKQFPKSQYFKESPLHKFDPYLSILTNTSTLEYPEHTEHEDKFIMKCIKADHAVHDEYESLIEQLKILYMTRTELDFEKLLPFKECFQIHQAIRSRTLEIPRDVETESAECAKTESNISENIQRRDSLDVTMALDMKTKTLVIGNNHDYVIDVTLAPILDFVNHCHFNNAYFDVDRDTNDILLKFKKEIYDSMKMGEEIEVSICYSPEDDIQGFLFTYGFQPRMLPNKDYYQLCELQLDMLDHYIEDGLLICKWLRILPQIQLIVNQEEIYFNFYNNNLPLLFIEDITYNDQWPDIMMEHFQKFNNIPADYDTHLDQQELINLFGYQEMNYDYINGIDPIGVLYKGEPVIQDQSQLLTLTGYDQEDSFNTLVMRAIDFLIKYLKDKQILIKCSRVGIVNSFDTMISEYQSYQDKCIDKILKKYEQDPKSLILPEEIAKSDWETQYRSPANELSLQ
ncbi:CTM1 [[Candida] subhashii]|uniref:CTM1 n=1 Tax=[Candida] subhashii TaxID=561895 RepID=A0A8J5QCF4_9ASCO|nr:CTM1 [[Candida] subhashii]KAG7663719.1 CTM1 [[Candida] subhashii]